jgi:hypothetical protein
MTRFMAPGQLRNEAPLPMRLRDGEITELTPSDFNASHHDGTNLEISRYQGSKGQ